MNKSNTIIRITSDVLGRYRNSITRNAFTQAMQRVAELTLGPGGPPPQPACPGLTLLQSPDLTLEQKALLICGACPPFPAELGDFPCHEQDCQTCWQSWLTTGEPPQVNEEAAK